MIFTNIYPNETSYFESTKSISKSQIIFSHGELIELDDCGFEDETNNIEYYIKQDVFENVSTLFFVINAEPQKLNTNNDNHNIAKNNANIINSNNWINNNNDYFYDFYKIKKNNLFEKSLQLLIEKSPKANIYIFIHKMDTILMNKREIFFEGKKQEINQKLTKMNLNRKIFATSIWDGRLYIPWREIMTIW